MTLIIPGPSISSSGGGGAVPYTKIIDVDCTSLPTQTWSANSSVTIDDILWYQSGDPWQIDNGSGLKVTRGASWPNYLQFHNTSFESLIPIATYGCHPALKMFLVVGAFTSPEEAYGIGIGVRQRYYASGAPSSVQYYDLYGQITGYYHPVISIVQGASSSNKYYITGSSLFSDLRVVCVEFGSGIFNAPGNVFFGKDENSLNDVHFFGKYTNSGMHDNSYILGSVYNQSAPLTPYIQIMPTDYHYQFSVYVERIVILAKPQPGWADVI